MYKKRAYPSNIHARYRLVAYKPDSPIARDYSSWIGVWFAVIPFILAGYQVSVISGDASATPVIEEMKKNSK